jgi:hypothetical protein
MYALTGDHGHQVLCLPHELPLDAPGIARSNRRSGRPWHLWQALCPGLKSAPQSQLPGTITYLGVTLRLVEKRKR